MNQLELELIREIEDNIHHRRKQYSSDNVFLYDQYVINYNKLSMEECKQFTRNDVELYLWTHKMVRDYLFDEGVKLYPDVNDILQTVNLFRYYTAKTILEER